MITLPLGALLTLFVFVMSMGIDSLPLYFNFHSALLVGGGTVAVMFFSTPTSVLKALAMELKNLLRKTENFGDVGTDLVALAKSRGAALQSGDELIVYGQDLWQQGVTHELFIVLISQKKKEIEQRAVDSIQCLKNLAKYPPAFGMAGTVMGIVTLFQTLESGKNQIGPALAMALTATFFGLAIANGIVMPLSDRLQIRHMSMSNYINNVYQVLLLINHDEPEQLIKEEVQLRAGAA